MFFIFNNQQQSAERSSTSGGSVGSAGGGLQVSGQVTRGLSADIGELEADIFPQFLARSEGTVLGETATQPSEGEASPQSATSEPPREVASAPPAADGGEPATAEDVGRTVASAVPSPQPTAGLAFAAISLFFGTLFFLYSLKYYLTLAVVLGFSRNVENLNGNGNGQNGHNGGNGTNAKNGLFRTIFGNGRSTGLTTGRNGNGKTNGHGPSTGLGASLNGNGYRGSFLRRLGNGHNGNGHANGGHGNNGNGRNIFRNGYGPSTKLGTGRNGNGRSTGLTTGQNGNGKSRTERFFRFLLGDERNGNATNGRNGNGYRNGNGHSNGNGNGNGFLRRLGGKNGNGKNGTNGKKQTWLSRLLFGRRNGNGYRNGNGPSTGLGASQNGHNGFRNGHNGKNGNGPSTGLGAGWSRGPAGMWQDVTAIDLSHQPFISVHLPFYNERKVANRILTATTAFDYQNYEVIVVDDSTDETKAILEQWARHPKVKVIHRENREGFKGGALKVALQATNPKAEFIVVFDADFVPYPDTLLQFLRYFHISNNSNGNYAESDIAAVQGYQWHVLNKNENWVTRAVRAEFAGSYVVERPGGEIIGALKQIAGSVFMVRRDLLDRYGWGTSITEDFELTVRLHADGYRVLYTPYIQGPSECVASLKRLIRQRMRWAEGHTRVIRQYFWKIIRSPHLKKREKVEFLYLAPYYLQAAFFLVGTLAWFVSDAVLHVRLPFWTALWGWSLVFTNMLALPLVNAVGLFLEESPRRDYLGIGSFLVLTYTLVPFQAFAALKGLFKGDQSPWFRTPKTGHITDAFFRSRFRRLFGSLIPRSPGPRAAAGTGSSYLRLTTSNNQFRSFRIRPRSFRWAGNAALSAALMLTLVISGLAPFIPQRQASASERGFHSLRDAKPTDAISKPPPVEIKSPTARRYDLADGRALEYIFHPEPRVRIKLGEVEIEMSPLNSSGLRSVATEHGTVDGLVYRYENVFDGVDLRYTVHGDRLEEDYILSRPVSFESIDERVKLSNLVMAGVDGEIQIASGRGGNPLFTFTKPVMYEEGRSEIRSEGIRYEIEKEATGYRVRKMLTEAGKRWLADPGRHFPVVFDPTLVQSSPTTTGITEAETDQGSYQRKLVYSSNSSAWYAFSNNGGNITYDKCSASDVCDADGDWAIPVGVSLDVTTQTAPSAWFQSAGTGAGKIFVSWIDDSNFELEATLDSLAFNTVDTANTDNLGTQCNTDDQGTITAANRNTYIAVGNNGDVVFGYGNHSNADAEMDIFQLDVGTSCPGPSVDWNGAYSSGNGYGSIEANSGLPTASQNVAVVPFEVATNKIQIIYNDAGGNADIRQSQVDLTDATTPWDYADNDVDGSANLNVLTFSAVSDGTSTWVLIAASATATDFFRCATCSGATAPTWTQSDNVPWSSQNNITEVSLTYISTSPANTLVAMILKDTTNEQAYFMTSDKTTISWGTEYNFNFTAGDNGNLSSVYSVANDTNVGMVIREGAAFSFSTLPERTIFLLLLAPFLPIVLRKLQGKSILRQRAT